MLPHVLEQITAVDLQRLIDTQVIEGKTIDYKKILHQLDSANQDFRKKEHIEFLKDVSSFANTVGGDLVIGMGEDQGVPLDKEGIEIQDIDKLKQRLLSLLEQWLDPRVGCSMHAVPVDNGRHVLIIRVPRSLIAPHRVVYAKEPGQFYARNSAGAYSMETAELRQAFTLTETILQQITRFSQKRVESLSREDAPIRMPACSKMILHLIPLESFAGRIAFTPDELSRTASAVETLTSQNRSHRPNLDGTVISSTVDFTKDSLDYVQLYRNGIIEVVTGDITFSHDSNPASPKFFQTHLEHRLKVKLPTYLEYLKILGIPLPIYCFLTLQGVKGIRLKMTRDYNPKPPFDRDTIALPNIQIDDYSSEPLTLLMPLFDMIWNAGGYQKCMSFDENGDWANAS